VNTMLDSTSPTQATGDAVSAARSALLGIYRPPAPLFVSGAGCRLTDADGRTYLDFTSGIAVNALGYGDATIETALLSGLRTGLLHTSNLYRTAPAEQLAQALVKATFAERVFFCNSGAEANEAAIKFARKHARRAGGAAKHEIVALKGSFHGRLFGSLAVTDRAAFREPFEPLMPGARFLDVDVPESWGTVLDASRTAALLVEPVQGEGGVRVLSVAAMQALAAAARDVGALLILDEIQCGYGRTGRLFAHETSGVVPDIMTLAKPMAGGLPMGAVLMREPVAEALQPGDHGTTFGGGPLVAGVALAVLRRIADPSFLQRVSAAGARLEAGLRALPERCVREVRGAGLMLGVELAERPAAEVVAAALERGLLLATAGERVVRLLPPLIVSDDEIDEALATLRAVIC
jgi:predicted acetylornithine/succinylornithine family transaminase